MTLVAAYNFDEASGPALDASGNGHDITIQSDTMRTAGHTGGGVSKGLILADASNNTALLPVFQPGPSRSISFWADKNSGLWSIRYYHSDTGSGAFGVYDSGSGPVARISVAGADASIPLGDTTVTGWHHYALVYDATAGVGTAYLDGVANPTTVTATPGATIDTAQSVDIAEGGGDWMIDDLRVYNSAISADQVVSDMNTPVTPDAPVVVDGSVAASLPRLAGSLSGRLVLPGAVSGALPRLAGSLAGTVVVPAVQGSVAAMLPLLTGRLASAMTLGQYSTPAMVRLALVPSSDGTLPATPSRTAADMTDAQLSDAISEADAVIDGYIGGFYAVPVQPYTFGEETLVMPHPVDYWSRTIAAYLATITYRGQLDMDDANPVLRRYQDVLAALKAVAAGTIKLQIPENVSGNSEAGAGNAINPYVGDLFVPSDFVTPATESRGWGMGGGGFWGPWP